MTRLISLCVALTLTACSAAAGRSSEAPPTAPPSADTPAGCETAGGEWVEFTNGCRDHCNAERAARAGQPMMCTMAITMGCECGPDRCWNGTGCEPN